MLGLEMSDLAALSQVRHPQYMWYNSEWDKWRLTMAGGRAFLNTYLEKFSDRETDAEFEKRKKLSYCAAYSKSAVREIINAIFQRMRDITRVGGPDSYVNAVAGRQGGVNREGMSMNMFMGQKILPELLSMGKVGVYIDMPQMVEGATMADTYGQRPYLYYYPVEDILNWNYTNQELRAVVLRDCVYDYDQKTGLPTGTETRYRYMWQDIDDQVYCVTYIGQFTQTGQKQQFVLKNKQEYRLNLKRIPFTIIDIGESLLADIADHQIALTNIESSDVSYVINANFPFYVEQGNNKIAPTHTKKENDNDTTREVGPIKGRIYPMEADQPAFIHPSSEPLKASMAKGDDIRSQIRHLIHLAVNKLNPQRESADSKALDNEGLEAGLAYIGLTLENTENFLAERWAEYTGDPENIATCKYPSQYSLQSDSERRAGAKSLFEIKDDMPSRLGRKELIKLAARVLFDGRVSPNVMDDILDEISAAHAITGRTEDIERDVEQGLVSKETASIARGYADGEAAKAYTEFMERLKFINDTQTQGTGGRSLPGQGDNKAPDSTAGPNNPAARGIRDASPEPDKNAAEEKQPKGQKGG
jgi:hypothetical protein